MIIPVSINVQGSTFTANARFPFVADQQVFVDSRIPNQVPAPLATYDAQGARVLYYVINLTGSTFQLSLTQGGDAITLTDKGIGQISVSEFPPLTWDELVLLPLLEISTLRDRFTTPESLINLSAASDQAIGVAVDTATNVFTSGIEHGLRDWTAVRFTASVLPVPLVAGTTYYARDITSDFAFKIASVIGGSAIDITTAGTGQVSVQNYSLNEVLEKKRTIGMQWLYDALLLRVSNKMKFVGRSWWWWFTPPTNPVDTMFYPAINRAQIVLDNLCNPEKLVDAIIDYTAWAMLQDASWRNLVKDPQFFEQFGDTAESRAKKRAEQRLAGLIPLMLISNYQGASRTFDFDQMTDTVSVALM